MKNWLDKYSDNVPQAQNGIEGTMAGLTDRGFNSNGAWGGQFQEGGDVPKVQSGKNVSKKKPIVVSDENDPRYKAYQDSLSLYEGTKSINDFIKKNNIGTFKKNSGKPLSEKEKNFLKINKTTYNKNNVPKDILEKYDSNVVNSNIKPISFEKYIATIPKEISFFGNPSDDLLYETTVLGHYKKPIQPVILEENKKEEFEKDYNKKYPPIYLSDKNDPRIGYFHEKGNEFIYKEPVKRKKIAPIQNNLQSADIVNPNMNIEADNKITPLARKPKKYKVETSGGGNFGGWSRKEEIVDPNNISANDGNKRTVTPIYQSGGEIDYKTVKDNFSNSSRERRGEGYNTKGRNYSPEWGGQFEDGGFIPMAQNGFSERAQGLTKKDNLNTILSKKVQQKENKKYKKKSFNLPVQPMLSQDTTIPEEAKKRKEAFDKVARPSGSQLLMEGVSTLPLMYLSNPIKAIGHTLQDTPIGEQLGNFNPDLEALRTLRYRPGTERQKEEDRKSQFSMRNQYATNAFINAGLLELGYLSPNVSIPQHFLKSGSMSNLMADGLQTQSSLLEQNYGDAAMNMLSMSSKLDNFDASNARKLIFNPSSLNRADKVDALKDITNLGFAVQQQTQRTEPFQQIPKQEDGGVAPQYKMGGSIPGSVGFTYARTKGIPSEGPYAKKTLPSAQDGFSERNEGLTRRDNIKTFKPIQEKDRVLTKAEKEAIKQAELAEKRGDIKKYTPQSKFSKVKEAALNPLTAFGYVARNEDIPENFSRSEDTRNILDNAIDFVNPAFYVESAENLGKNQVQVLSDLSQGNFGDAALSQTMAGVEALNFIPLAKGAKPLLNKGMQQLGNIKTSLAPELRQGLQTNGFLDIFKSKPKFQSEIDWGKWNKEIPDNSQLMREYNTIEQTTKANGSWMKNPDGSTFQGTPEQFVQQNSENFKKAFPNPILDDAGNVQYNYHGSPNKFNEFDKTKFFSGKFGKGVYTSADKKAILKSYANPDKSRVKKIGEITGTNSQDAHLYELYLNSNNKKVIDDITDVSHNIKDYGKALEDYPSRQELYNKYSSQVKENSWIKTDEDFDKFLSYVGETPREKVNLVMPEVDFLRINDTPLKEQVTPFSNYPKSAVGNNGMFDMTNPNIYKSLVPIGLGLGAASQMGEEEPIPEMKQGGVIKDDMGYWNPDNWGSPVEINSNNITMEGVYEPLLGVSDKGERRIMYPGEKHKFKKGTKKVTEFPIAKNGIRQEQKGLQNLDQLTNFTNYNKPTVGGWLDKY
jgi:hypothetical protein